MLPRTMRPLLAVAGLLLICWLGLQVVRAERGRARAELLAEQQRWAEVRLHLRRYLRLHPGDHEARLLLAEALASDELLPAQQSAEDAIRQLQRIPEDSPLRARACLQQGRLELLVLLRPAAAERSLRRAVALDDPSGDAWYLLWKLLDLTGRSDESEAVFWPAYALAPEALRAERLREWYLSQFYPATANPELERMMGLLGPEEVPAATTELRRFGEFRRREPREPLAWAAIAHWTLREGAPADALQTLDEALGQVPHAPRHPFFASTLTATLLNLGEFERATEQFAAWPGQRDGYVYWKLRAMLLDEVQGDYAAAIEAYDRALRFWPGPVDWRSRHRQANCLSRLGRHDQAARQRQAADRIIGLLEPEIHEPLRRALAELDRPENLRQVLAFYESLGCSREVQAWSEQLRRLEQPASERSPTGPASQEHSHRG